MIFMDLKGTSNSYFQIQKGGPRLVNTSGAIEAKDAAGSSYANLVGAILKAASDTMELNSDAAGAGADWKYTIARPVSGMASALTFKLPSTAGASGEALLTDGAGNLYWGAVTVAGALFVDMTTVTAVGGTRAIPLVTLPIGAYIDEVQFIVDTPFDANQTSLSVGIVGTLEKYMAIVENDLQGAAKDVYSANHGQPVITGSPEAVIADYIGTGGTPVGSGRVIVKYASPL
jgi:hypothetical protein